MNLDFEKKKEIYEKHCEGYGSAFLSREYGLDASWIRYLCRVISKHGLNVIKCRKYTKYSSEDKLVAINRVLKNGETVRVLCRFNEYNLLTDTLVTTNNILYYASMPEKMSVTNTSGTFTATFVSGVMMSKYSSTSVPAGWLIPLTYINVGRMVAEGDELARVNIIVPHSQGTSSALASVIPCYYEITYERGI